MRFSSNKASSEPENEHNTSELSKPISLSSKFLAINLKVDS